MNKLAIAMVLSLYFHNPASVAEKITEPVAYRSIQEQLMGIVRELPLREMEPWGDCLSILISPRHLLASAHCVVKRDSKEIVSKLYVQSFPLDGNLIEIPTEAIHIHPKYVPSEKNLEIKSLTAFDIAIIELPKTFRRIPFQLSKTGRSLRELIVSMESCGSIVVRLATVDGQPERWLPVFNPITPMDQPGDNFVSRLFGQRHQQYDTVLARTSLDGYGADSGGPIVCRDEKGREHLVGLERGGGRGDSRTLTILQDLFFDSWISENFPELVKTN